MIQSLYHLLQETANAYKNQVAAKFRLDGQWQDLTWGQLEKRVHDIAAGLIGLEVKPKDRVCILSSTRIEWSIADLAILATGACTVPIYQSSIAKDIAYILNDAEVEVVFVEGEELLNRVRQIAAEVPKLRKIICIESGVTLKNNGTEMSWRDLSKDSDAFLTQIAERTQGISENDLASIVYTSGTTGEPKGAMLTHDNLLYEARAIEKLGIVSPEDVQLIFLPLAHVFAKVLQIAWLKTAHVLAYAESMDKVVENMKDIRPTMMAAVPRVYEKIRAKVVATAEIAPGLTGLIAKWAFAEAQKATELEKKGKESKGLRWSLAQKLVFSKINARLNETFGGRLRFFVSGGAPLSADISYFFKFAGITVIEGYGLTETSAATCVNLPTHNRIGTVGKPVPGTEVKISSDGEICVRGRGVFKGYYGRPKETEACLDAEGWFYTGDIGHLDQSGCLKITDRKKDIIVTAGGKKVAPQKLENLMKAKSALIGNILIHGDHRPFLIALVAVDEGALKEWALAKKLQGDYKKLSQHEALRHDLEANIKAVNAGLSSYEQIKKFAVLDHEFTVGDQLTPTLKVKRNVCVKAYGDIIDALYA